MNNIPNKLKRRLAECEGNQRKLARQIGINPAYVNALLKHGKEPSNPEIRKRLFLPKKTRQRKDKSQREAQPEHINWWRRLKKEKRTKIILSEWQLHKEEQEYLI